MNLQKNFEISLLLEFYSKLLTPRQKELMRHYYYQNMSLGEIALNFKISRQAVLDTLQKATKSLKRFEESLGMLKKYTLTKEKVEFLQQALIQNKSKDKTLKQGLEDLLSVWEES